MVLGRFPGSNIFLGEHLQRKQEEQREVHGQEYEGDFHFRLCLYYLVVFVVPLNCVDNPYMPNRIPRPKNFSLFFIKN